MRRVSSGTLSAARVAVAARWLVALGLAAAAQTAASAVLTIAVMRAADDERLDPKRVELAYLGHPGGPIEQAVEVAVSESAFELDAARLQVKLSASQATSADDARAQAARAQKSGAAALLVDWPAPWVATAAATVRIPVFNVGSTDDRLRQQDCRANLFHTVPSERMLADALAQTLVARKWTRVLLLHGPSAADAQRLAAVQAALRRYGLKTVATKPFKLSGDPRERDLAHPLLLTGGADYDVVWVVDTDGEFARALPYRTALPRPVVGNAGLAADAWAPHFERYGAPQLARRFARHAQRPMTGTDWAAWMAAKAVLQAALQAPRTPPPHSPPHWPQTLVQAGFTLDGFKGVRLSFRAWDRQLRQPLLLTDGQGVIATAPVDGVLHPSNALDTLGADQAEKLCQAGA